MDTPPPDSVDALVLDRVLAGTGSAADHAAVDSWAADLVRAQWLAALREPRRYPVDTDATLTKIKIATHTPRLGAVHPAAAPRLGDWARRSWVWGAALVCLVVAGVRVAAPRIGAGPAPRAPRTYATGTGQKAVLTLGDGTRVTLAPRTRLVLAAFDGRARDVVLDGEAYFDVAHAGGAPFTVTTGRVTTRVLGTAFLVRHYASDAGVAVAVESGKVAVTTRTGPRSGITLTAGHAGVVGDSGVTAIDGGDVTDRAGWMSGRLVFHDEPAARVLATLSRWYGYDFRFADGALAEKSVTVVLSTESSADALSILGRVLDVEMRFEGNVVTLVPRRGRTVPANARPRGLELTDEHVSEVGR